VLRAFWRGEEVATLNDLNATDIPNIDITIFDAADLVQAGFGS